MYRRVADRDVLAWPFWRDRFGVRPFWRMTVLGRDNFVVTIFIFINLQSLFRVTSTPLLNPHHFCRCHLCLNHDKSSQIRHCHFSIFWENILKQTLQEHYISPVWIFKCFVRSDLWKNVFKQTLQKYGFWFVWVLVWYFKELFWESTFLIVWILYITYFNKILL